MRDMAEDRRPPSFEAFDRRLARAWAELAGKGRRRGGSGRSPYTEGLQAGIEVIGGLLGGGLLGWALDRWTGLRPLFLLLFLVLGGAAGLLNAYRHLRRTGLLEDGAARQEAPHGEPVEGDGGESARTVRDQADRQHHRS